MSAYYNEFDPKAAAWLRELIKRGLIADGEVDDRSILDVQPDELRGFTQCHFFAGIGGWSYALRLAGWPDDRPVWTGSPPCQPFSAAGAGLGRSDARHLAPHFISLVRACRPRVLFGEQVASAAVFGKAASGARKAAARAPEWAWLDDLQDRLEAAHYAVGASDIPAAGIGGFHIRQRTFFGAIDGLADTKISKCQQSGNPRSGRTGLADGGDDACGLADTAHSGRREERANDRGRAIGNRKEGRAAGYGTSGADMRLADTGDEGLQRGERSGSAGSEGTPSGYGPKCSGPIRLADADSGRQPGSGVLGQPCNPAPEGDREVDRAIDACGGGGLADTDSRERDGLTEQRGLERNGRDAGRAQGECESEPFGGHDRLADTASGFVGHERQQHGGEYGLQPQDRGAFGEGRGGPQHSGLDGVVNAGWPGADQNPWRDPDWLFCRDGKWRPVEPGTFPLAHGIPARVVRLRGYGNAIVPQAAAKFIEAFTSVIGEVTA